MDNSPDGAGGSRTRARRLAMQAVYQQQLNPLDWRDLYSQYAGSETARGADLEYLKGLLQDLSQEQDRLSTELDAELDRPFAHLDPVERSILLLGALELEKRAEVPYRVVINEAVELARRFGATGGHRYINGVLDRCARRVRPAETAAKRGRN